VSESKRTNGLEAEEVSAAAKGGLWSTRAGRLVIIAIAAVLAFGVGFVIATDGPGCGGFYPPVLVLAIIALYSGVLLGRMLWGALAGLACGIVGAAGMGLRLAAHPADLQYWYLVIGILGGQGGILCTITGAISGGLVELFRRSVS
jgi:hypothetical protein